MTVMQVILLLLLLLWRGYTVCPEPLCHHKEFDTQVQYLLSYEMLTEEQIDKIKLSFKQIQDILRIRWQDAELFAFGSLFTGLGTKISDIDFYLRIPNYNTTADAYIIKESAEILSKYPERFSDIVVFLNRPVPLMSYHDISIKRDVDISVRSRTGVENTKLVAYYLSLDKRLVPLTALIKFWFKVHHLTGKSRLPNYAVYLMVIFYLQQKRMSPTGQQIQTHATPRLVNNWNLNFEPVPYTVHNRETLYHLLGGFFKYYSEFDFTEYCVSGYIGRAVARNQLQDINKVPKEFSLYAKNLERGEDRLALHTGLCVQDVFIFNNNVAKRLKDDDVLRFKSHVKFAAEMYDITSCDMFLREILLENSNKQKREH